MRSRRQGEVFWKPGDGRFRLVAIITTALLVLLWLPVGAETIVRKDGRKIQGQIVQEGQTYIMIRTSYGTFRIRKADIKEVTGRRPISDSEREGHEAFAAGNYDAALAKFQAALSEATKPADRKTIQQMIAKTKAIIQSREEARFKSQLTTANQLIAQKRFADALVELQNLLRANEDQPTAAALIRRRMGELYMAEAAYYENQINYAEAADAYLKAIEQMPDAPEPYLKMARLARNRGRPEQEIIDYYVKGIERALRTKSEADLVDDYYELGRSYLRAATATKEPNPDYLTKGIEALLIVMRNRAKGYRFAAKQLEDAFAELSKTKYDLKAMTGMLLSTLEINPDAQKVRWILAETYSKIREYKKALDQLLIIEKRAKASGEPFPPEFYYRLGLAYLALPTPDNDAALDAFETEIAQNKRNYLALIRAAEIHEKNGTYDSALEYCDQAITLRKERPEAYLVAADTHMRRSAPGDLVQARRYLKTALNLKADFHEARIKLAELEIRRQREAEVPNYDEATALLFKVQLAIQKIKEQMRTDEDRRVYAESILLIAEIESDKKHYRQALDMVQTALNNYPNFPSAYRLKGDIHQQLDEYDKAKASYEKAIKMDPRDPETYMKLGILCHTRLNEYDAAIKYYQAYIDHGGSEIERASRWIEECRRRAVRGAATGPGTASPTSPTRSADTITTGSAGGP